MSNLTAVSSSAPQPLRRVTIVIVLICWLIMIFEGYDTVVYGTVVPALLHYKSWGLNTAQTGAIGSILVVGLICGALCVSPLADLFGRRRTMILNLLVFSISLFLCGLAPNPLLFSLFRFIGGLGLGGFIPASTAITVEYAPLRLRSFIYTIMFSGYSVGGVLAAGLAIPLIPAFGWQVMFYINALGCLLAAPLAYLFLPESIGFLLARNRKDEAERLAQRLQIPLDSEGIQMAEKEIVEARSLSRRNVFLRLFAPSYLRITILFACISFCGLFMIFGVNTWLPQLMQLSGYSLTSALLFLLVLNVGTIVGNILAGAAADRFGSKPVSMLAFGLGGISFFLLSFHWPILIAYLLIILVGNGSIGAQNLINAYVAKSYPVGNRASGIGWALGMGRFGGLIGPNVLGLFQFWHVSLQWDFYVLAIPGIFAALLLFFLPKSLGMNQDI